jgi:hypothetical protein
LISRQGTEKLDEKKIKFSTLSEFLAGPPVRKKPTETGVNFRGRVLVEHV